MTYLTELTEAHRYAQKKVLVVLDEVGALVDAVERGVLDVRIYHMLRSIMQHNDLMTFVLCTSDDVADLLEQDHVFELLNVTQSVKVGHLNGDARVPGRLITAIARPTPPI